MAEKNNIISFDFLKNRSLAESDSFSLEEYAKENNLSSLELDIIEAYMNLDSDARKELFNSLKNQFNLHP